MSSIVFLAIASSLSAPALGEKRGLPQPEEMGWQHTVVGVSALESAELSTTPSLGRKGAEVALIFKNLNESSFPYEKIQLVPVTVYPNSEIEEPTPLSLNHWKWEPAIKCADNVLLFYARVAEPGTTFERKLFELWGIDSHAVKMDFMGYVSVDCENNPV